MFQIMTADQAVSLIKDGDCIGINAFLAMANPGVFQDALAARIKDTGGPRELSLFCASGFGVWTEEHFADQYMASGAIKKVVAGHFASMPVVSRMALNGEIECYCLPLGVLSQSLRAAAAGMDFFISKCGLNIFVDPRIEGPALNSRSKEELVRPITIDGEEYLMYKTPKIDVALLKGTTVDPHGNISFENENVTLDALALAQAVKNNGGKVLVQVERVSHLFGRPRDVIVPGILVDAVVVDPEVPEYQRVNPILSGELHVATTHMDYWVGQFAGKKEEDDGDHTKDIIGRRASMEMKAGQVVNIGIGTPEKVGVYASSRGVLKDVDLTVEAGGIGGLPAPGIMFGSTIGADMVCDMASQFDFYDGGGLDICFMGALEVDRKGNVNVHRIGGRFTGIGGFANITGTTKNVIFCTSFRARGLVSRDTENGVVIQQEGQIPKFKKEIQSISFSAANAVKNGQRVLYVTERCVFELTKKGLKLKEVYPGIDKQTQILDLLDFELAEEE